MLSKCPVVTTLPFRGLAAAETFYSGKLGLKRTSGSVADGWLEFTAGDGTRLGLFESDSKKSDDTAATFEVDDLDEEMRDLRTKGVVFEEYDLPDVKTDRGVATMGDTRGSWFKDPGGNVIALIERE